MVRLLGSLGSLIALLLQWAVIDLTIRLVGSLQVRFGRVQGVAVLIVALALACGTCCFAAMVLLSVS
jgi:hypothetical protein